MNVIQTKQIGNYRVEVFYDEDPTNPREDENLSTMVCFHNRYTLGDKHDYKSNDFDSWDDLKSKIIKDHNGMGIIRDLYLFDHSGISISIRPFGCSWDSGQVGFIFVPMEDVRKEYNVQRTNGVVLDNLERRLQQEVETYDKYLRGECYGYTISKVKTCEFGHEHVEEMESVYGFLDLEQCISDGESSIKWFDEKEQVSDKDFSDMLHSVDRN
jgi:hypothetical protein